MLLPVRVPEPDRVSLFQILTRECREEFGGPSAFGIIAVMVHNPCQKEGYDDHRDDPTLPAVGAALVVLLRIHERHVLSIMEAGEEEKVPESSGS